MMGGRDDSPDIAAARPSLFARIMSRLRGEPGEDMVVAAEPDLDVEPQVVVETAPPLSPLVLRQWLWGSGFHQPGNADYVLKLVKPFGLTPAMSMLDVAAGLGGAARVVAEKFGAYITGLERDPELARLGMEMSIAAGKQKHASISAIDPESFELRTGAFDCILGRGATYMVQDKERFMRVLILGLKQRGQLLLTDYVVEPSLMQRPEYATWTALQPLPPMLWTVQQYTDCFKSLGFDVRITEDITHDLKLQIVMGWDNLLQTVDLKALPRAHKLQIVAEAERWVKTIIALDAGVVKGYRFYALAGSARPPLSSIRKAR
jgi:cyclopropane fatty-acyl-phospholipid synthase-like methyltransferase